MPLMYLYNKGNELLKLSTDKISLGLEDPATVDAWLKLIDRQMIWGKWPADDYRKISTLNDMLKKLLAGQINNPAQLAGLIRLYNKIAAVVDVCQRIVQTGYAGLATAIPSSKIAPNPISLSPTQREIAIQKLNELLNLVTENTTQLSVRIQDYRMQNPAAELHNKISKR